MPRTMIEPFRIKSVEPIRMTTAHERLGMLEAAKLSIPVLQSVSTRNDGGAPVPGLVVAAVKA